MDIWPVLQHPTLYPFLKDLFLNGYEFSSERKPSEDGSGTEQVRRVSRAIPRDRKPSHDLRTSWLQKSDDAGIGIPECRLSRTIPRDRKSSKDLRMPWHVAQPEASPRTSSYEAESSMACRGSVQDQELSAEQDVLA